ncbi:MAG: permease prefix domain 1-containing protein, partial [Vicinamibacterales bacterium]
MGALRRFCLRLVNAGRPGRREPDLAREISTHLTLLEDEFQRRGMSREDARLAAKRAFGSVEQTKDRHRDARAFAWIADTGSDLRLAIRSARRRPGFSLLVVLTLALGVGA